MPKAGSYRGNDFFHCIVHLFDVPTEPGGNEIKDNFSKIVMDEFAHYYGINNFTSSEFAALLEDFLHPFDREVLLGEVLKNVFYKHFPEEDVNSKIDKVNSENLLLFLNGIGGRWRCGEEGEFIDELDSNANGKIIPTENGCFFDYGNDEVNKRHENLYDDKGKLREIEGFPAHLLELVTEFDDLEKQKEKIQVGLHEGIKVLRKQADELGFEKVELENKEIKKQPILNIRSEGSSLEKPKAAFPSQSAHAAKGFDPLFLAALKPKFTHTKWSLKEEINKVIKFSKKDAEKEISIKQTDNGMQFTGTESSIAKAAGVYQTYLASKNVKAVCEIEADSQEAAITFMKKLKEQGFDISKISEVTCDGKKIAKPEELIAKAGRLASASKKNVKNKTIN